MNADFSEDLVPGRFVDHLAAVNQRLPTIGFERFLFLPGMTFGSMEKWWGAPGRRTFSHEGIDLCLFRTRGNLIYRLDETIRVPLICSGKVVGLIPDFLGFTVIVRHRIPDADAKADFYTLYGHVSPIKDLAVGDALETGAIFADIAKVDKRRSGLPAHLHISAALCHLLPPAETLTWPLLNRADRAAFIDPVQLLAVSYEMVTPAAAGPLYRVTKCGSSP